MLQHQNHKHQKLSKHNGDELTFKQTDPGKSLAQRRETQEMQRDSSM